MGLFIQSWSPMIFPWFFCISKSIISFHLCCMLRGSDWIWMERNLCCEVHWKPNSFWHLLTCQNKFEPQWSDIEVSLFNPPHYLQARTENLLNLEGVVCKTSNRIKSISHQRYHFWTISENMTFLQELLCSTTLCGHRWTLHHYKTSTFWRLKNTLAQPQIPTSAPNTTRTEPWDNCTLSKPEMELGYYLRWLFCIIQPQIILCQPWYRKSHRQGSGHASIIPRRLCRFRATHCHLPRMKHFEFRPYWQPWQPYSRLFHFHIVQQALQFLWFKNEWWKPNCCRLLLFSLTLQRQNCHV